jgi:hypothetical protein
MALPAHLAHYDGLVDLVVDALLRELDAEAESRQTTEMKVAAEELRERERSTT